MKNYNQAQLELLRKARLASSQSLTREEVDAFERQAKALGVDRDHLFFALDICTDPAKEREEWARAAAPILLKKKDKRHVYLREAFQHILKGFGVGVPVADMARRFTLDLEVVASIQDHLSRPPGVTPTAHGDWLEEVILFTERWDAIPSEQDGTFKDWETEIQVLLHEGRSLNLSYEHMSLHLLVPIQVVRNVKPSIPANGPVIGDTKMDSFQWKARAEKLKSGKFVGSHSGLLKAKIDLMVEGASIGLSRATMTKALRLSKAPFNAYFPPDKKPVGYDDWLKEAFVVLDGGVILSNQIGYEAYSARRDKVIREGDRLGLGVYHIAAMIGSTRETVSKVLDTPSPVDTSASVARVLPKPESKQEVVGIHDNDEDWRAEARKIYSQKGRLSRSELFRRKVSLIERMLDAGYTSWKVSKILGIATTISAAVATSRSLTPEQKEWLQSAYSFMDTYDSPTARQNMAEQWRRDREEILQRGVTLGLTVAQAKVFMGTSHYEGGSISVPSKPPVQVEEFQAPVGDSPPITAPVRDVQEAAPLISVEKNGVKINVFSTDLALQLLKTMTG